MGEWVSVVRSGVSGVSVVRSGVRVVRSGVARGAWVRVCVVWVVLGMYMKSARNLYVEFTKTETKCKFCTYFVVLYRLTHTNLNFVFTVRFVIAVLVRNEKKLRGCADINSAIADFKATDQI